MSKITIESIQPDDWPAVRAIYLEGIATRNATYETDAPSWEQWDAARRKDCRLVARHDGAVLGFACLSPVSARHVYRGVAEATIYVAAAHRGRGVGTALMKALIEASEAAGVWTLQAGVFPENAGSLRLTSRCGFRIVGTRAGWPNTTTPGATCCYWSDGASGWGWTDRAIQAPRSAAANRLTHFFFPRPHTARPGFAPVCSPSLSTCMPLTNTCTTPVAYWCGCSNVAWSMIFAGSNTTTSAK